MRGLIYCELVSEYKSNCCVCLIDMAGRCEGHFWKERGVYLSADEPCAAASGIMIMVFGVIGDAGLKHDQPYVQFFVTRASLIFTGIGTCAFHCLSDEAEDSSHTNRNLYDGVSMALFTSNLFLLHLNGWLTRHRLFSALLSALYLYFWVVTNDADMFSFLCGKMMTQDGTSLLSEALQYPIFVLVYVYILARILYTFGWRKSLFHEHRHLWIMLGVGLLSWVLCEFGCRGTTSMFWGHTVWHLAIGYVAMYLTIIGAQLTYGLEREGSSKWFPRLMVPLRLEEIDCEMNYELVLPDYFGRKR